MNLLTQVCKDFKGDEKLNIKNNKGENVDINVEKCDELETLKFGDTESKCLIGIEIVLFIKKDDPFVDYYGVTSGEIKL